MSTNSVIVWNPGTGPADRHDKQIVQPFGEYLPWRSFFSHLSTYADRAGYFVPGTGNGVVTAAGVPIGVTTCWEVIFDRAARESVLNGAQLLTVPSNNATFTEAMSEQQLAFARLRAVEHDRYVVVAGTTGISAVIAPDGRELARTSFFEPAYLDHQVRLKTQLTPATRWGPIVQGLLVVLGVAAADRRDAAQWEFRASARSTREAMKGATGGRRQPRSDRLSARVERTLVIIPTYNERENLPLIVGRVHAAVPDVARPGRRRRQPRRHRRAGRRAGRGRPGPRARLHRPAKDGLGAAYLAGLRLGR